MNAISSEWANGSRTIARSIVTPLVRTDEPKEPRSPSTKLLKRGSITRSTKRSRQRPDEQDEFRFFVDRHGRQHFNFRQQIWLDSSVQMAFTRVYSTALKTLAVNLLTLVTEERDCRVAIGRTSRRVLSLAPVFSRQCLMGAPDAAWALPKSTIESWLQSQRRRRRTR
jgi:hypothetical protein